MSSSVYFENGDMDIDLDDIPPSTADPDAADVPEIRITNQGVAYRHTFDFEIPNYSIYTSEQAVLQTARDIISRNSRGLLEEVSTRMNSTCRPCLRVVIDTRSILREDASVEVDWRLLKMQDMITDGLGWFPGLPWRHEHFTVEIIQS